MNAITINPIGSQKNAAGSIYTPELDGSSPDCIYTYCFSNGVLLCMAWVGNDIVAE